ncbi:MAG: substrate-binding domain-containing protein, partial [Chloroflexota bacterium]
IADERVSYITPDYYVGSVDATRYLLAAGHRRIGLMTRPALGVTSEMRLRGYKAALAAADIPYNPALVVPTRIRQGSGAEATRHLLGLPEPPTAIFAFHDLLATEVVNVAREDGLSVPDDLAVMGFDGLRAGAMTFPQITTMRQPLDYIGRRVVEILAAQVEDPTIPPIRETVSVELVRRGSV